MAIRLNFFYHVYFVLPRHHSRSASLFTFNIRSRLRTHVPSLPPSTTVNSDFPPSFLPSLLLSLLPYSPPQTVPIPPSFYSFLTLLLNLSHFHPSLPHGLLLQFTGPTSGSLGSAPEDPPPVPLPSPHSLTPTPRGGRAAASQRPWPAASPTR